MSLEARLGERLAITGVGLLWPWLARLGLGRLAGDVYFHCDGFTFYAPIAASILISVVLSLILWPFGDDTTCYAPFNYFLKMLWRSSVFPTCAADAHVRSSTDAM